jgi:hypothetical protein
VNGPAATAVVIFFVAAILGEVTASTREGVNRVSAAVVTVL